MATHILVLRIERFRGIRSLAWRPSPRSNVILGGGDVGKTTILDAIALLLSPSNTYTLADADYWQRDVEAEFLIEAILSLSDDVGISQQSSMAWPWEWDGQDACLPQVEAPEAGADAHQRPPVYKVRLRGTADLEMVYEIVQPDGTCNSFPVALRRAIGLVRLSGDDRNDRDLRLIHGAGLDRLLADKGLRARLGRNIAAEGVEGHLVDTAQAKLAQLNELFGIRTLPTDLGLGFIGSAGLSVHELMGFTAEMDGIALHLFSCG
jgi:putative ATP-dependent endonuclease of OLD family